jgi:hypothetical protein
MDFVFFIFFLRLGGVLFKGHTQPFFNCPSENQSGSQLDTGNGNN